MKSILTLALLFLTCTFRSYELNAQDVALNSYRVIKLDGGGTSAIPFFYTEKEDIKIWLDSHGIENYIINPNNTVSVDGTVKLAFLDDIFIPVKFWNVKGDFIIYGNRNLSNLYFAPVRCYTLVIIDCPNITTPKGLSQPNMYDKLLCEWDILLKGDMLRTVTYWNYFSSKYPESYKQESDYVTKLIKYLEAKSKLEYLQSSRGK